MFEVKNVVTDVPLPGCVNVERVRKYHTRTPFEISDDEYEVAKIRAVRKTAGKNEYLCEWEGYKDRQNSWVHEDDLDCPQLIEEFVRATAGMTEEEIQLEGCTVCEEKE